MSRTSALINFRNFMYNSGTDCFGEKLFALIMKADSNNLAKLKAVFPTEVEVWRDYKEGRINDKGETK